MPNGGDACPGLTAIQAARAIGVAPGPGTSLGWHSWLAGGAADVEGDRGACPGEEERIEPVGGEPGVLDGGGAVAAQTAAAEQGRLDGGIEQILQPGEAGTLARTCSR